jgi:hypothetical protein
VNELLLDYDNIEFVNTFIGRSNGMILELDLGVFRTELHNNTNISDKEIWIRVAEIYINDSYIGGDINFDLGLEDNNGRIVWINSGEVGSIPPPTNSYGYPHPPYNIINNKSVFRTLRFPAFCFSSKDHFLNLNNIRFIMIRSKLDPKIFSGRKLALDDLQIVKVKMGLSIIDDLPIVTEVKKN